mgnify:CR=1 FL=1
MSTRRLASVLNSMCGSSCDCSSLSCTSLAKLARFVMDKPAAPTLVRQMLLQDRLGSHKETRVEYLSRTPKTVPETWLNPMFLARNPALE